MTMDITNDVWAAIDQADWPRLNQEVNDPADAFVPTQQHASAINEALTHSTDSSLVQLSRHLQQHLEQAKNFDAFFTGDPSNAPQDPGDIGAPLLSALDGSNLGRLVTHNLTPPLVDEQANPLTRVAAEIESRKIDGPDKAAFLAEMLRSNNDMPGQRARRYAGGRVLGSLDTEQQNAVLSRVGSPSQQSDSAAINARARALSDDELTVITAIATLRSAIGHDDVSTGPPAASAVARSTGIAWFDQLDGANLGRFAAALSTSATTLANAEAASSLQTKLIRLVRERQGPRAQDEKLAFVTELLKPRSNASPDRLEYDNAYVARQQGAALVLSGLPTARALHIDASKEDLPKVLGNLAAIYGNKPDNKAHARSFQQIVQFVKDKPDAVDTQPFFDVMANHPLYASLRALPVETRDFAVGHMVASNSPADSLIFQMGAVLSGRDSAKLESVVSANGSENFKLVLVEHLLKSQEVAQQMRMQFNVDLKPTTKAQTLADAPVASRLLGSLPISTLEEIDQSIDDYLQPFAHELLRVRTQ